MTDTNLSIKLLKTALADEWLAHYQYWVSPYVASELDEEDAIFEIYEHEKDEKRHANMIAERLVELECKPITDPADWAKFASPFIPPDSKDPKRILAILIEAEKAAIDFYKNAVKELTDKDEETCDLFEEILKDEIKHHSDLLEIADNFTSKDSADDVDVPKSKAPTDSVYHCSEIEYEPTLTEIDVANLPQEMDITIDDFEMDDDEIAESLAEEIARKTECDVNEFLYTKMN